MYIRGGNSLKKHLTILIKKVQPLKKKYKTAIRIAGTVVILLGIWVLIINIFLKLKVPGTLLPANLPMAPDAAFCFILAGLSLLLKSSTTKQYSYTVGNMLAVVITGCAVAAVTEDFVTPTGSPSVFAPIVSFGMSPHTAFSFVLLGMAFICITKEKSRYFGQVLLHFITLVALIVVIGHLFSVPELHQLSFVAPMAVYTGIGLLIISVAATFLNPSLGVTGMFTGNMIGNLMARRLFFQMFASILIVGYLRVFAHRHNLIGPVFGSTLMIIVFILVSLSLIWKTSRTLNAVDHKRKRAQNNFKTAFESAPYALILSDTEGIIRMINYQTEILYGYSREELLGKNLEQLIPESMHAGHREMKEQFFSNPLPVTYGDTDNIFAIRKDGLQFPIEISLTPVHTKDGIVVLTSVIDITARKASENTIKDQLAELQFKNQEMEQFNYIASHDLQEPLRTVSNYITLLEEDYPNQINGEIKMHLSAMDAAIGRMSTLVKALLDFGRLGRHKKLSFTNCNNLVEQVIADLNGLIQKTGATITVVNKLPSFYTYEVELRQLFQNLINNAIKFSSKNVIPEVKIGVREIDGFYEFYVSDNGIGIAKGSCESIFHIFQKLNSDTDFEGHGIGLANCKKVAEMHGGKIWVESEPGKGSTFKFTILNLKA